jgi:hypothetical protein
MSTSPTSTCHWTIDTPENHAAWDAVTRSDSYFTPAVTYGDNNIDNAASYNDYRRGRRSPGLASDILDATTPLRDMEESETHIPSRIPSSRGDGTASRSPILEDGGRCVGRRLPLQSLLTTGKETSPAGESASHTPYPNAAVLFKRGDDEDDDIKCGQCDNPITYCHCSPTMLPPRIDIDQQEDHEEASVPLAEDSDKENRSVEVRVGRGMGEERDHGGGVQAHHRRMYAPGTPQRVTCHSLSPTPDGFVHNRGQNYVPFASQSPADEV